MTDPAAHDTDVLVVGGGPAGSTIATLLARKGWSVTQVERERHPRFHIGESLLPMNMPIFERLGVMDRIAAIGLKKPGADFPCPSEACGYNTFRFTRMLTPGWDHAFQVKREDFDHILFDHAGANGVTQFEGLRVVETSLEDDGVVAQARAADGVARTFRAKYFIDATGRDAFLGAKLGLKRNHPKHRSAALFAHFRGVERRPGDEEGNISIYRFADGWIWLIPLRDGITSIGAVCGPEYLKQRKGRNEDFLLDTLRAIPDCWARLQNAEVVGNLHATGNYSYLCSKFGGKRWLMVGDAFAFVDPIFSSGVLLAMRSAELGADVVDGSLREPQRESALQREYTRVVKKGIDAFSWFIYRFTTPTMKYLFAKPRNMWRVEEGMISMLAGDVFGNREVDRRLTVFKTIYYITALGMLGAQVKNWFWKRRQMASEFSGGTTSQDHA